MVQVQDECFHLAEFHSSFSHNATLQPNGNPNQLINQVLLTSEKVRSELCTDAPDLSFISDQLRVT